MTKGVQRRCEGVGRQEGHRVQQWHCHDSSNGGASVNYIELWNTVQHCLPPIVVKLGLGLGA